MKKKKMPWNSLTLRTKKYLQSNNMGKAEEEDQKGPFTLLLVNSSATALSGARWGKDLEAS